jgi:predicted transcriptional regulator of viral defense system
MPRTPEARLLQLTQRQGILTARAAARAGIHSQQLSRLVARGELERIGRGQYIALGHRVTEHHGLAMAAAAVPDGVICLLSALVFHRIGTSRPADIWLAIRRRQRTPRLRWPPLRAVRMSEASLAVGVETHRVEGVQVQVFSVAKTLADLFKYRNQVGLDLALEALHDAWRHKRFTMDALNRAAQACRVERVMRPYLEAVVT